MSDQTYISRIVNGHRVFGRIVVVFAPSLLVAKLLATTGNTTGSYAWEAKEIGPGKYEVLVAKHEDVFAMND